MSNPTIGMFVGDQEIERRSSKSEGTVVQLARCVLCTHRGFPSGQFATETCPMCGCKCKFSVVVQEVDRCVKCGDSKGVDANGLCLSDNCLKVACRCVFPSTSVSEVEEKEEKCLKH